ncbi:hypothetical protein AHMF7605_03950 [Adhaeribacter arboris]|uniref:DUF4231 domain-containing protein n=1 Tax=Adhaeribacter arboris TaxID=2072846 RepID=A0A2T2YB45_9BACT|nr:hypothetical protein [Adhaeribacter arboris]PSR52735.1 hypothetical protein AHMF7605_03950 [Adhaeribacter arboris]
MHKNIDDDLIIKLQQKLDLWLKLSMLWANTYWIIGILGLTMSALATADFLKLVDSNKYQIHFNFAPVFSIISTICFGILGFANPQRRTARYIRSYRILETSKLEYLHGNLSVLGLLKKYKEAELLLNESDILESNSSIKDSKISRNDTEENESENKKFKDADL